MRESPRVLIAISGGIAAYKIPELVRMLQKQGNSVRCMMTASAREFVSPLVLETLTHHPVGTRLWGEGVSGTEHIEWARWPDLIVFAPATAQTLARLAHGFADDFVSTVALASRARKMVAPAMNTAMWENPATQANLKLLAERGFEIIEPESGILACGEDGAGKLASLDSIVASVNRKPSAISDTRASRSAPAWHGKTLLITAGPTRTFIDAVRYITNPSTGLMGKTLAEEALRQGATVHYVLGTDKGVVEPRAHNADEAARLKLVKVTTASEMLEASLRALPECDGIIATAAVMDYEVAAPSTEKLKRSTETVTLTLTPAPDVLAALRKNAKPHQWFMGFAAETSRVDENGARKLKTKTLDFVFANPVAKIGETLASGFGSPSNGGFWIRKNPAGHEPLIESWPLVPKNELASKILDALSATDHRPQ